MYFKLTLCRALHKDPVLFIFPCGSLILLALFVEETVLSSWHPVDIHVKKLIHSVCLCLFVLISALFSYGPRLCVVNTKLFLTLFFVSHKSHIGNTTTHK